MNGVIGRVKNYTYSNRKMLWYMFCFALLGLIDQRKQSASGEIQMLFSNSTPLVIAALLFPSMELDKLRQRVYKIWTPICLVLVIFACIWGKYNQPYMQAWIPTVLSLAVWSYLLIYIVKEWRNIEGSKRIHQPFFWGILLLLLCMILSVNPDKVPYWYVMMYGGFYLIGIKKEDRQSFFDGLLNGVILWFFIQQIIAFGFRPYDDVRYRGLYVLGTFNGLFYLIAYCAFAIKWLLAVERKAQWYVRFLYFFLSTGCVSFVLLTGGRSAIIGLLASTIVLYGWYDLKKKKSFYGLLIHAFAWILCVAISFPMVYGCVRYFPTILHHPIWFEGEYVEGQSVCSFDEWDSDKYISLEEIYISNFARILELLKIDLGKETKVDIKNPFVMQAYAAERVMDEETSEKILHKLGVDKDIIGISVRKIIYVSCLVQLNWQGHTSGEIASANGRTYGHAHNMFLDMAYRHGIMAGILYLGLYGYCILQTLWRHKFENIIILVFMLALLCFGMFEQLTLMGQFGVALIWILFNFAGDDSKSLQDKKCKN